MESYAPPGTLNPPSYPASISDQAFFSSSALHRMKSRMSGCSALRITIFAARRVFPPDLITPANASYPFIKDTGPDAVPPPESVSFDERRRERFDPVPEPHLKSLPSVFASSKIESIVSSTELMKHAEHWGFSSMPQLNQTGLLNDMYWLTSRKVSSSRNVVASCSLAKYFPFFPHSVIVRATRSTRLRTLFSRSGVPIFP